MADFPPGPEPVTLVDAMSQVAAAMVAAGIPTALDPADLSIPGAVVYPSRVDYDTLSAGVGGYELTVDLVLVAGDVPGLNALAQLDGLLGKLRGLWAIDEARAVSVGPLVGQSPDPLPGLSVTVTLHVSNESE